MTRSSSVKVGRQRAFRRASDDIVLNYQHWHRPTGGRWKNHDSIGADR